MLFTGTSGHLGTRGSHLCGRFTSRKCRRGTGLVEGRPEPLRPLRLCLEAGVTKMPSVLSGHNGTIIWSNVPHRPLLPSAPSTLWLSGSTLRTGAPSRVTWVSPRPSEGLSPGACPQPALAEPTPPVPTGRGPTSDTVLCHLPGQPSVRQAQDS